MAERDNAKLTEDVLATLREDAFIRPLTRDIQVIADNGVVFLVGSMDDELDRQTIEHIVRQVPGVKDVQNQLTMMGAGSSSRPDADIQREILNQMRRDPTIQQPERFNVRVRLRQVYVSGTADSDDERSSVLSAVARTPGVEGVEDRMKVRVPIIDEPGPPGGLATPEKEVTNEPG